MNSLPIKIANAKGQGLRVRASGNRLWIDADILSHNLKDFQNLPIRKLGELAGFL